MRSHVITIALALALSLGLGTGAAAADPAGEAGKRPKAQTVMLQRAAITPSRVTLEKGGTLTFRNASDDTVKLLFRGKGNLAKNITCTAPAGSPPGPALDELIDMEGDELSMLVPSGRFPGACTFVAGDYTFDMYPEVDLEEALTPPRGQVFAK